MINMQNINYLMCKIFLILFGIISFATHALPKIHVEHRTNGQDIPSVKVTNKTALTLACYVAVDGYKKRFILQPYNASSWFSATDNSYNHTQFSTWCDSLEFHPEYEKYRR